MKEGASKRSKIRALRSFQISQHMRMIRDLIPFRETPVVLASAVHHAWSDSAGSQLAGSSGGAAIQLARSVQICLVNLHSKNRWFPVSRALRHNEHTGLWGQPLECSLSAVQSRFWIASQLKNLHFGGTQAVQMRSLKFVLLEPKNCAW